MQEPIIPPDDEHRKKCQLFSFLMGYFPHAQVAKAVHSYESNAKHTGEPGMVWASEKSVGDGNQIMRHLVDAFESHSKGDREAAEYHLTCLAWRADELLERYKTRKPPFDGG